MKYILFLIFIYLLTGNSFCQLNSTVNDTIIINPKFLDSNPVDWKNWLNENNIQHNQKVICYYDSNEMYKIFEGTALSDSINHKVSWKLFYLNGQIKESFDFNPFLENDSNFVIKTYFINGELKSESYAVYTYNSNSKAINNFEYAYYRPKIKKRWDYAYNGQRTLIEEFNDNTTIKYDVYNGDTVLYKYKDSSGSSVYKYYEQNQLRTKKIFPEEPDTILYRPESLKNLIINLDIYRRVWPRASRETDGYGRSATDNLKNEMNKLDSLELYKNIESLTISINNEHELSNILSEIAILPTFKNLRELRLIGSGFKEIPKVIFRCKNLQFLELVETDIKKIPKNIESLKNLTCINLTNNSKLNYSKTIKNLTNLPNLKTLIMSWDYRQELPNDLIYLNDLKTIVLEDEYCRSYFLRFSSDNRIYDTVVQKHNLVVLDKLDSLVTIKVCLQSSIDNYLNANHLKYPNLHFEYFPVCFPANTQILKIDGKTTSIDSIIAGTQIISYNESTNKIDTSTVNHIHVHNINSTELININFSSESKSLVGSISATFEHPFFCNGKWIEAEDLKLGQKLMIYRNETLETVTIMNLETIRTDQSKVFNLNTSSHTFFANGVLVHNK